jgi:hypothetical protein
LNSAFSLFWIIVGTIQRILKLVRGVEVCFRPKGWNGSLGLKTLSLSLRSSKELRMFNIRMNE